MGEIAEMMLSGDLCEGCGVYLPNGQGVPQRCRDCRSAESQPAPGERVQCPTCRKTVKFSGLQDHHLDVHGAPLSYAGRVPCPHCGKQVKEVGLSDHLRDVHKEAV